MPSAPQTESIQALQLYYLFGVSNECKLTVITNEQLGNSFVKNALPFMFQFYRAYAEDAVKTVNLLLCDHIFELQKNYVWALNTIGSTPDKWITEIIEFSASWDFDRKEAAICDMQKRIAALDGQHDLLTNWSAAKSSAITELDTESTNDILKRLEEFEKVWVLLLEVQQYYRNYLLPLCLAPEQLIFEIKASMSHLAAAAFQFSNGSLVEKSLKNIAKVAPHLERIIIDIFKIIIVTILQNQSVLYQKSRLESHEVSSDVWHMAIQLRHDETSLIGNEFTDRRNLYCNLCKELLSAYIKD